MTAKLAFLAMALAAGPATAAERSFTVGNFQELHAAGPDDVAVISGGAPSVVATGDQRDLDRITAEVDGGRLEIGRKDDRSFRLFDMSRSVKIRVTVPALHAASLTGSGSVRADRLKGDSVSAAVTGSGSMNVAMIEGRSVALKTRGSGGLSAAGHCTSGDLTASGSGGIDARKLACRDVRVSVSGSGGVTATASGEARLSVSGSGSAIVGGNPAKCQATSSGSGSAACR